MEFVLRPTVPPHVGTLVEPVLERLKHIIPTEYQYIFIGYHPTLEKNSAQMEATREYRYGIITIGPLFLSNEPRFIAEDLLHECVHFLINPMDHAHTLTIETWRDLPTDAIPLSTWKVLQQYKTDAMEGVVCDLTRFLLPIIFPEFANVGEKIIITDDLESKLVAAEQQSHERYDPNKAYLVNGQKPSPSAVDRRRTGAVQGSIGRRDD